MCMIPHSHVIHAQRRQWHSSFPFCRWLPFPQFLRPLSVGIHLICPNHFTVLDSVVSIISTSTSALTVISSLLVLSNLSHHDSVSIIHFKWRKHFRVSYTHFPDFCIVQNNAFNYSLVQPHFYMFGSAFILNCRVKLENYYSTLTNLLLYFLHNFFFSRYESPKVFITPALRD